MQSRMTQEQMIELMGKPIYGSDGDKIGDLDKLFADDQTGRLEWLGAKSGLFGTSHRLVPAAGATPERDGVRVPYTKDKVKDAPDVSLSGGHISEADEQKLYDYYGTRYE